MSIKYYDKSGATPEEKLLAGVSPVDAILNGTSKNAIQNKAVYNALKDKLEKATTDLIYYYTVNDVYNKSEVRALIGAVETLTMEVVSSLPVSDISTTTIYLLKPTGSNVYDEYVYINDAWVKIGTTDMDLSGYMLTADFNVAIADYFTKAEINNMLNSYYTKTQVDNLLQNVEIDVDNELSSTSENPVQNKVIKAELDKKQGLIFTGTQAEWDALSTAQKTSYTFCNITDDTDYVGNIVDAVTDGEMSAITSNAVYDYPIDSIADGQHRPPTSNAVYDYPIDSIADGEHRPPTSNAVYDQLAKKQNNLLVEKKLLGSKSQGAGTFTWTLDVSKTGYSILGIVGWSIENRVPTDITSVYVDTGSGTCYMHGIRPDGVSSANFSPFVCVLYGKS